jgi:general stress protein 26
MSSFSNTDTGSKTADPYTAKNLQDPSLKEKVDKSKFCMMTTKTQDGLLASRCMAVAARVSLPK